MKQACIDLKVTGLLAHRYIDTDYYSKKAKLGEGGKKQQDTLSKRMQERGPAMQMRFTALRPWLGGS